MQFGKVLAAATAAASLMTSTAAFAGTATRANTALPQASATAAPVTGVRTSAVTKKKSELASSTGIVIGVLAVAATAAGIVAVASNDSKADSPG
tara:strand:- start:3646 stop:3927 length:282 start_codon:yes stop_codon:yes gene_type:complete